MGAEKQHCGSGASCYSSHVILYGDAAYLTKALAYGSPVVQKTISVSAPSGFFLTCTLLLRSNIVMGREAVLQLFTFLETFPKRVVGVMSKHVAEIMILMTY